MALRCVMKSKKPKMNTAIDRGSRNPGKKGGGMIRRQMNIVEFELIYVNEEIFIYSTKLILVIKVNGKRVYKSKLLKHLLGALLV